ncbi:MAG TPA: hypothetical protein VFP12_00925 [Allosphingosinicella sp.]|nr:hypothetical protein [Allosphingosinicella sp.]
MATYREIIEWIRARYGFLAQTCWIADVKEEHGRTRSTAPNRIDPAGKVKPCPPHRRDAIREALAHFGMI